MSDGSLEYTARVDISAWTVLPDAILSYAGNWRPVYSHIIAEGIEL